MSAAPCGCPQHPGRRITDPVLHAAWHARVVAQGGPVGVVNTHTLREARGISTPTPLTETVVDQRARDTGKRANGTRRRAARDTTEETQ